MYTKEEFDKLSAMYDGDKDRDATSKIRGFLFQDYITIMCLLQNQVNGEYYLYNPESFFRELQNLYASYWKNISEKSYDEPLAQKMISKFTKILEHDDTVVK